MPDIPTRPFGKHSLPISALGLGDHHLGDAGSYAEAERIMREAIDSGITFLDNCWEFDSVRMPLNPFDGQFRSFEQEVLPVVNQRGMAALGMKSLGGTGDMVSRGAVTAEEALRYAMSLPVATTISGIDSLTVLRQSLAIARGLVPMTVAEQKALRDR